MHLLGQVISILCMRCSDIPYSIMGHVHFRKSVMDDGRCYLCPCLGYPRQWRSEDIYQEINETIQIIEI